jgi:hypothetical protein
VGSRFYSHLPFLLAPSFPSSCAPHSLTDSSPSPPLHLLYSPRHLVFENTMTTGDRSKFVISIAAVSSTPASEIREAPPPRKPKKKVQMAAAPEAKKSRLVPILPSLRGRRPKRGRGRGGGTTYNIIYIHPIRKISLILSICPSSFLPQRYPSFLPFGNGTLEPPN